MELHYLPKTVMVQIVFAHFLKALDQKVRILARRWELEQENVAAKAKEAPVVGAGQDGFFLRSADGNFQLRVRGYLPTNLVPNRDVGAQLHGDLWDGAASYAVGVFNGVPDLGNGDLDNNDGKDFAGRLFALPFKNTSFEPLQGFGIGFSGTYGRQTGTVSAPNLPAYLTQDQLVFFKYRSDGPAARTAIADDQNSRWSPP